MLNKHRAAASVGCPSLKQKRVTVHRLRHTMAMDLLQAGVDRSVIALWLGHVLDQESDDGVRTRDSPAWEVGIKLRH
jgi:integrase